MTFRLFIYYCALGGGWAAFLAWGLVRMLPVEEISEPVWRAGLIGGILGLMVGLAQGFLKEAWVAVETGRRAGRRMMLSKEETTIGRAEGCDIGLFGEQGIEKVHARILMKHSRYVLEDAHTAGGTFVNE